MTQTYDVVFSGETMPEMPVEQAKENLAKLFRSERAAIDRLFERGEVTLKRSLGEAEADRYLAALRQAGVLAYKALQAAPVPALELTAETDPGPVAAPSASFQNEPSFASTREAMCCPKCGASQPKAEVCSSCGVVIAKFIALKERQASEPDFAAQSPYAPPIAALDEHMPEFGELKVFSISGRIGRLRYIGWSMALMLIAGAAIVPMIGLIGLSEIFGIVLIGVAAIAAVAGGLMMGVQRLHDIGWTGWLILLNFIPLVGSIFPLVLMIAPGSRGLNRYGPPPPPNSTAVKVLAGLFFGAILIGLGSAVMLPIFAS